MAPALGDQQIVKDPFTDQQIPLAKNDQQVEISPMAEPTPLSKATSVQIPTQLPVRHSVREHQAPVRYGFSI